MKIGGNKNRTMNTENIMKQTDKRVIRSMYYYFFPYINEM